MVLQVAKPSNQRLPRVLMLQKIAYPRRICLITQDQPEKNEHNPNSQSNQITHTREN